MGLISRICEIEDKLEDLCEDCPDAEPVAVDTKCETYNNPLATGYDNWNDTDDLKDLADEYGIALTEPLQLWVRVLEFKCGGVSQVIEGKVYGPYASGSGTAQFFADLAADTASTCLQVTPTTNPAINGSTTLSVAHDSTKDCTLVLQEGVNNIDWFSSVFGFMTYQGQGYDFIDNNYNGPIDGTDPETGNLQIAEFENCEGV